MAYSVGLVNLGCAKNQVDGEIMLAALKNAGYQDQRRRGACRRRHCQHLRFYQRRETGSHRRDSGACPAEGRGENQGHRRHGLPRGALPRRSPEGNSRSRRRRRHRRGRRHCFGREKSRSAGKSRESFPEKTQLPLCGERHAPDAELVGLPENRGRMQQPLFLLRHSDDPRQIPFPHDGKH